jgi:hypothetical protein
MPSVDQSPVREKSPPIRTVSPAFELDVGVVSSELQEMRRKESVMQRRSARAPADGVVMSCEEWIE